MEVQMSGYVSSVLTINTSAVQSISRSLADWRYAQKIIEFAPVTSVRFIEQGLSICRWGYAVQHSIYVVGNVIYMILAGNISLLLSLIHI